MRPRNREISIFNLSMVDVISGAMAAFLIILVVLLPYYKKEHIDYQAINAELRQALAAAEARAQAATEQARQAQAEAQADSERLRAAQAQAQSERQRAEGLARQLAKTFLVLYVRWDTHDDVDLHVINPAGAEFYFGRRAIQGHAGELSEDTIIGPGAEVWEVRNAPPGDYQVSVLLYAIKDRRKPVLVKGRVFHRDGSSALREVPLQAVGQREAVAAITVDAQGDVTVH